jgi:hypothetical protein
MVVMVAVGSWSLGLASTVGIVYNMSSTASLYFLDKYLCRHKIYSPCPDRADKYTVFILGLFWHKS